VENSAAIFIPYVMLSWFLAVAGLRLELGIWKTTGKGTPAQQERRSNLRPLCLIKMIPMSLFRLSILVLAALAILMIRGLCRCDACPRGEYRQWNGKHACRSFLGLADQLSLTPFCRFKPHCLLIYLQVGSRLLSLHTSLNRLLSHYMRLTSAARNDPDSQSRL